MALPLISGFNILFAGPKASQPPCVVCVCVCVYAHECAYMCACMHVCKCIGPRLTLLVSILLFGAKSLI